MKAERTWKKDKVHNFSVPLRSLMKNLSIQCKTCKKYIFFPLLVTSLVATIPGLYFRPLTQLSAILLPSSLKSPHYNANVKHFTSKTKEIMLQISLSSSEIYISPEPVPMFSHFEPLNPWKYNCLHEIVFLLSRYPTHFVFVYNCSSVKMCVGVHQGHGSWLASLLPLW